MAVWRSARLAGLIAMLALAASGGAAQEGGLELRPSVDSENSAPAIPQAGPPQAPPDAAATPAAPVVQPLRIGVLAGRDARTTLLRLEPMVAALTQALRRPAEILPMSSYGAMIDAQRLQRIDGGFFSASAYALAEARCACLEPLVAPAAADGSVAYHAVIVTRQDSDISSVADLDGLVVAGASADSIGGRRMQLASLRAEGVEIETLFGEVQDAGSSEEAVRRILSGDADAAFAWSSLSGTLETGYSRGTLANLVARGEVAMSDLALIWRSPAITHGPFAVRRSLAEPDKAAMEAVLLDLETTAPAAYDALSPFYEGGFAPVNPEDYAGVALLAEHDVDKLRLP